MNTKNKIYLSYQLTKNDYIEAAHLHSISNNKRLSTLFIPLMMLGLGFIDLKRINSPEFLMFEFAKNPNSYMDSSDSVITALFFIATGIILILQLFPKYDPLTRNNILRSYKKNCVRQESRNLEIDYAQIKVISNSYREIRIWKEYIKFVESLDMFLLYYEQKQYQIIPKRSFNSELELELFCNIIETKISNLKT